MVRRLFYLLTIVMILGCRADDTEYTREYQCYFTFNTQIHNASIINSCINPLSPGMFCMAWQEPAGGVRHVKIQLNNGKTNEDVAITTAEEARQSCIMGASNGLIIGCSTLNNGQLYAFDRQCPNCLNEGINKPLQWGNNGLWVKCPRCNRSYDLNNSGFVVDGDGGKKLLRYHARYTGTALIVSN